MCVTGFFVLTLTFAGAFSVTVTWSDAPFGVPHRQGHLHGLARLQLRLVDELGGQLLLAGRPGALHDGAVDVEGPGGVQGGPGCGAEVVDDCDRRLIGSRDDADGDVRARAVGARDADVTAGRDGDAGGDDRGGPGLDGGRDDAAELQDALRPNPLPVKTMRSPTMTAVGSAATMDGL